MKKFNQIYLSILFIVSLGFASCEKEIEFDKDMIAPKLVINSFIQTDSLIDLTIATSKAIPGVKKEFVWIDNATVQLFVDNVEIEELIAYDIEYPETEDDSYDYWNDTPKPTKGYKSVNTKVEVGKTYKIVVDHPDYEQAISETTIPYPVTTSDVTQEEGLIELWDNEQVEGAIIKFKFKDPADETNYYRLMVSYERGIWRTNYWDEKDTTGYIQIENNELNGIIDDDQVLNPNKDNADDLLFGSPYNRYNLFTDEFIEGKEHEIRIEFALQDYWYMNGEIEIPERHEAEFYKLTIDLQSLSREAYFYMKSSHAQSWYDGDFLSEPVQAYSNIDNGVGVFAGFSTHTFTVSDGQYPMDGIEYVGEYKY